MSLELLRGVSTYFLIHECCPWKKVWVNYRMQCPARPLCSLGTSQHSFDIPFFLCSSYPPNSVVFSDPFMVGSYFPFPLSGHCGGVISCSLQGVIALCYFSKISSLAIFLSTLWPWKWMFVQLAFPFCCFCSCISVELGAPGEEESAEGKASHLPVTQRLAPVLLPKRWKKKSCKSVDK